MKKYLILVISLLFILGCSKDGADGATPFIGTNGNWWIGTTDTGVSATGKDGVTPTITIGSNGNWWINGADTGISASGGEAYTPYIGDNGDWWINGKDTGVKAAGTDGTTPTITIGDNGDWWINGKDTGVKAAGTDGTTPTITIGDNGNWWINGKDTGVKATGSDGTTPTIVIGDNGDWWINGKDTGVKAAGTTPTIVIGDNGNWWVNGVDTGVPATGKNGATPAIGANGNWWIDGIDTGVKATGDSTVVIEPPAKKVVDNPAWSLDKSAASMQYDMTFVLLPCYYGTKLTVGSNDEVAAFIDGKCVGLGTIVTVTHDDATVTNVIYLMVKGNATDADKEVSIKYYDKTKGYLYENSESIKFVVNDSYGAGGTPYLLNTK